MGKSITPPETGPELSVNNSGNNNKDLNEEVPNESKEAIVTAEAQHGVQAIEAAAGVWGKWDLVLAYALFVITMQLLQFYVVLAYVDQYAGFG